MPVTTAMKNATANTIIARYATYMVYAVALKKSSTAFNAERVLSSLTKNHSTMQQMA